MEDMHMDLMTVLIAAVANLVIGYVWYSKYLFGTTWLKYHKMSESSMKEHVGMRIFYSFILIFVMAYVLAFFEMHLNVSNVRDGVFTGFLMWLGFVATIQLGGVVWKKKPFNLFLINTIRQLLGLVVMGGILAA